MLEDNKWHAYLAKIYIEHKDGKNIRSTDMDKDAGYGYDTTMDITKS